MAYRRGHKKTEMRANYSVCFLHQKKGTDMPMPQGKKLKNVPDGVGNR